MVPRFKGSILSCISRLTLFYTCIANVAALKNGRELTPTMGWTSILAFKCDINQNRITEQVDLLNSTRLAAANYKTVLLDCGWQGTKRGDGQVFQAHKKSFRNMTQLGDYIHQRGMNYGLMTSAGKYGCGKGGKLSSLGHEASDIKTFISWGMDFWQVKFCWGTGDKQIDFHTDLPVQRIYKVFSEAVKKASKPITFAIDTKGIGNPASWPAGDLANIWRIGPDLVGAYHQPHHVDLADDPTTWANVVRTMNLFAAESHSNKPGAFTDLDLLLIGHDLLSHQECITQFAFWAAAKSPLMISADIKDLSSEDLKLITHSGLIAINQDSLGEAIRLAYRYTGSLDIWTGRLSNNDMLVVIVNYGNAMLYHNLQLKDIGLRTASVHDVWADEMRGTYVHEIPGARLKPHGVVVWRLSETESLPTNTYTRFKVTDPECHRDSGVVLRKLPGGATAASNLGKGVGIAWKNIDASGHTETSETITIDYVLHYAGPDREADCSGCAFGMITVNDLHQNATLVSFPASTSGTIFSGFKVRVSGFKPGKDNKVTITSKDQLLPDIIAVNLPWVAR